jgi:hypothetical protein
MIQTYLRLNLSLFFFAALFLTCVYESGLTAQFSDLSIGYSISLPEKWERIRNNDSIHSFYDTTRTHVSRIFISRHSFQTAVHPTPESWTRSFFLAYKISIDYSGYPNPGQVLYFDTTQQRRLDGRWAPELYAFFIIADTLNPSGPPVFAWSEFLKVTAVESSGYEVYALGDTADMLKYVDFYDSIMSSIKLNPPSAIRNRNLTVPMLIPQRGKMRNLVVDPLGRVIPAHSRKSAGRGFPYCLTPR